MVAAAGLNLVIPAGSDGPAWAGPRPANWVAAPVSAALRLLKNCGSVGKPGLIICVFVEATKKSVQHALLIAIPPILDICATLSRLMTLSTTMAKMDTVLRCVNQQRAHRECLSIEQMMALVAEGIVVDDPFAVQISRHVVFQGPCHIRGAVYLLADKARALTIGCNVYIEGPATLEARNGATLSVGDHAVIGPEGGFHVKANRSGSSIVLGERIRLFGGGAVFGQTVVGNGAQILGRIQVVNCQLAAGADYTDSDPDARGAVLKGMGLAEGLTLGQGDVIQSFGVFSADQIRRQVEFHPKPMARPYQA